MTKRSSSQQSKHDKGVKKSADYYDNQGYKVYADISGYPTPRYLPLKLLARFVWISHISVSVAPYDYGDKNGHIQRAPPGMARSSGRPKTAGGPHQTPTLRDRC